MNSHEEEITSPTPPENMRESEPPLTDHNEVADRMSPASRFGASPDKAAGSGWCGAQADAMGQAHYQPPVAPSSPEALAHFRLAPRTGQRDASQAYETSHLADYVRSGDNGRWLSPETKNFSTAVDREGGYLVPEYLEIRLEEEIAHLSPIRRLAHEIIVSHGSRVQIVRNQSGFEASWVSESENRDVTQGAEFVEQAIALHELYACPVASQRFLDDTAIDVESWIIRNLANAFAAAEARAFVYGDGVSQPLGLLRTAQRASPTISGAGIVTETSGNATGLPADAFDRLIDFMSGLDGRYRTNAVWLMNAATLSVLRRLKDGDGHYIWQPSVQLGQASQLLGFPVIEDAMMPDLSAGAIPIAFGDFAAGFTIVRRQGLSVLRDPYSIKPNVAFYATRRVGGAVTNMDALRLFKIAS